MMRSKRGVTVAEAVVAMTIIIIVSVTAISMITRFSIISANMMTRDKLMNYVENSLEAFKFAENEDELYVALYHTVSSDIVAEPGYYWLKGENFELRILVRFDEDRAKLWIYSTDANGDTVINVNEYTKALGAGGS